MSLFNGFKLFQEEFKTRDLLIVGHEVRLEVEVVSLRNWALFGLHNLLDAFEKHGVKFFNDVMVGKLLEPGTEFPNFFHWHFFFAVKKKFPDCFLVVSSWQGSLAELFGPAQEVAFVLSLKFSHSRLFNLEVYVLAWVDSFYHWVLLSYGHLNTHNRETSIGA